MKIYFSAKNSGFYFDSLIEEYKKNGTFPDDAVVVTESEYKEYQSQPPFGMKLGSKDGHPVWVPDPDDNTTGRR